MASPFLICAHADPTRCYELRDEDFFKEHYEPQGYYIALWFATASTPSLGGESAPAPEPEPDLTTKTTPNAKTNPKAKA